MLNKVTRKLIRELIVKAITEQSATGAVGGYLTKYAFAPPGRDSYNTPGAKILKKYGFKKPPKFKSKAMDVIRYYQEGKI